MMRQGHYAAAAPLAITGSWLMVLDGVNVFISLLCAVIVVWSSTWNDLDHPRFKGKMHPGAALVRGTGHLGYMLRTDLDKQRDDVHRGPSHCIEWCLLLGVVVYGLTSLAPPLAPWAIWLAAAVTLGTFSHILADSMTPSGVPFSAVYNWVAYREVWKRHSLGWFSTNSGAERFGAVPVLYLMSVLIMLAMVGWIGPIFSWLLGGVLK